MHVLDRSHLSHTIGATVVAAVLAVVIALVLAAGLGDVTHGSNTATPSRMAAPAAASVSRATPTWLGNPFTTPLGPPVRQPWNITRR